MKRTIMSFVAVLAVGSFVASAWAGGPKCGCGATKQAAVVAQADMPKSGGCCGNAAKGTDGNSSCCQACDKARGQACPQACGQACDKACGQACPHAGGQSCDKGCGQKPATLTSAQTGCGDCPKACKAAAKGYGPHAKRVQAVLASIPHMEYRVGDETMQCPKSARTVAEKTGGPMYYVVGDRTFTDKGEAVDWLNALLEMEVDHLQTVQYSAGGDCFDCPKTAQEVARETNTQVAYRACGFDFTEKGKAQKAVQLVREKLSGTKMTYKVGDQCFGCDKMAGATAKKTGQPLHYIVGDEETTCPKTAKLKTLQGQIRTIVETAATCPL